MSDEDRYYVCVTCGHLKHEDLFESGDCTCMDCYDRGSSSVNWHEAKDGDGYVANE